MCDLNNYPYQLRLFNDWHPPEGWYPRTIMKKDKDGNCVWYLNGKRHRDGGLPAIEWASGSKEWWVNGKQHRDGGLPAVEWANGSKQWWINDKRHRDDGLPAIEYVDGNKQWWIDGKRVK